MVAYDRGDYLPAIKLLRPLAQPGNAKAQNLIGVMHRKGEGVARSFAKAFLWFSLAAKRGDAQAKANLQEMAKEMTPVEIAHASENDGGLRSLRLSQLRVLTAAQFIRHAAFRQQQEFREPKCAPQGFSHPSHWP